MELHDQRDQSPTLVCNSKDTGTLAHQERTCAGASSWIQRVLSEWRNKRRKEGAGVQRRLIPLCILIYALAVPLATFAATGQSGSQYSPTFSPGYLIAWWICNGRKRNPIGGWLLFFYWGVYSSLLYDRGVLRDEHSELRPGELRQLQQICTVFSKHCAGPAAVCCQMRHSYTAPLCPHLGHVEAPQVGYGGRALRRYSCYGDRCRLFPRQRGFEFSDDHSGADMGSLHVSVNARSPYFLLARLGRGC